MNPGIVVILSKPEVQFLCMYMYIYMCVQDPYMCVHMEIGG